METTLQLIVNKLLTLRNYAHFYHLNVTGSNFLVLHEKYKEIYDFADDAADTVAELIKQESINTVVTFAGETTETVLPCSQMSDNLIYEITGALELINAFCKDYQNSAQVQCNELLTIAAELSKQKWMLIAQNMQ